MTDKSQTTNPSPSTHGNSAALASADREIGKHVAPSVDGAGSGHKSPTTASKPCDMPGCSSYAIGNGPWCPKHRAQSLPTDRPVVYVIDLWGEPGCDCGICEQWTTDRYAVGWYCGPVKEDIGQCVPEWGPDAIAMGRTVCRSCHDKFYGVQNVPA